MSDSPGNPGSGQGGPETPGSAPGAPSENERLSVVAGGALYRLMVRGHLLRPPLFYVRRRILAAVLLTWGPLALLSLFEHGESPDYVSFFRDIEVNVRFLVSLPLLIAADLVVHSRLGEGARQFSERGIVTPEHTPSLHDAARRAIRLRDAVSTELILLIVVILIGRWSWRENAALTRTDWSAIREEGRFLFTAAGYWYAFVSLPIYQFIVLRWYLRLFIWFQFLFRVVRIPLRLVPGHPDRAAGLAFVGQTSIAFAPVLFAQGALIAGIVANRIFHEGRSLVDFKVNIAIAVAFVLICNLGPLFMFTPKLTSAKRRGRDEYGLLAEAYVQQFEDKWMRKPATEPLLGSSDIQSLADMNNSYAAVEAMRPIPFALDVAIKLAIAVAAPLLPLILTVIPLSELLKYLAKAFL